KLRQDIVRSRAVQCRAARKRRDACITRGEPCTLRRQAAVGRAGADDDPMGVVASLRRDREASGVDRTGLQRDRVPTFGAVQCLLEVSALGYRNYAAGGGRVDQVTLDLD